MEGGSAATNGVDDWEVEAEEPFDWKHHVIDLERKGNNCKFKCKYCSRQLSGGKTRLVGHFVGAYGVAQCAQCPDMLVESLKADRKRKLQVSTL